MRPEDLSGVDIDICDSCHGVWLDRGELEQISDGERFANQSFGDSELSKLKCPRCLTRTFGMIETERGTFAICITCNGVFVGGKTLKQLAGMAEESKADTTAMDVIVEVPNLLSLLGDLVWLFGNH
jgi:Zn-finger nucleic acid-binding protein